MRIPSILLCLVAFAIPLAACGSTSGTTKSNGKAAASDPDRGEPTKPAASTKGVTGKPIRLEWRNLNPRYGEQRMGLINRSSPDLALLYRKPKEYVNVKPVEDDVMANMLSAVRESDYFKLAEDGKTADEYEMGDGHGVVWVQIGDESWTLLFRPMGAAGENSPVPRTYRDIKLLIMNVYNQTLWFSTSTSGDQQPFRIEPHKYSPPKR